MKTDKTQLIQAIEAIKAKLAIMEEELNKHDEYKHFPIKGDEYYYYFPWGRIDACYTHDNEIRPNTYKTREEAEKAYNKAVALEKVKRRIVELQGDWKPDWTDDEVKYYIQYDHCIKNFIPIYWLDSQQATAFYYMKSEEIALTIIKKMEDELKLIFDIQ